MRAPYKCGCYWIAELVKFFAEHPEALSSLSPGPTGPTENQPLIEGASNE